VGYVGSSLVNVGGLVKGLNSVLGTGSYIGGVYGYVNSDVTITGLSQVGGLISETSYVGEVVGYSAGNVTLINDYVSMATVVCTGNWVAGMVGYMASNLYGSNVTYLGALVSPNSTYVGGLTSYVITASIYNFYGLAIAGGALLVLIAVWPI
jgi:hypothetical protein